MSNGRPYSAVLCILFVSTASAITSTRFMTSYCHKDVIFVNHSLILELTDQFLEVEPTGDNIICAAKIVTNPGSRLMLHFVSLDISFHDLSPDRLHIFDYSKNGKGARISPVGGIYGIYDQYYTHKGTGVEDYFSSDNMFRLDYIGRPTIIYRGFRLLITSIKDSTSDKDCPPNFFRCSKGPLCIPVKTVCNGDLNCGMKDDSDESQCNWSLSTGLEEKYAISKVVTSGVLASLSFIAIVILVFGILYRINRRKYLIRRGSMAVHVKRDCNGKLTIANDMGLTTVINAPPTYDDVIADDVLEDPPPAYDSLPCSVRNSCELSTNHNGSVTIICVPNRDIHLYNEGNFASNIRCYSDSSVDEECDVIENGANDRSSSGLGSGRRSSGDESASSRSLTSELEEDFICDRGDRNDSNDQIRPLVSGSPSTINKTDSNDNLVRHKNFSVIDDDIEYMDDDE